MPPVKCSTCNLECRDSWNLKRHEQSHIKSLSKPKGPFVCSECQREFRNNYYLKRHVASHEPRERKKINYAKCMSCRTKFESVEKRDLHKKVCDRKGHICAYCNKRMRTKSHISRHIHSVHLTDKPPKIQCPLCSTQMRSMIELDEHLAGVHFIDVKKVDLVFDNREAFQEWKEELENTTCAYFVKEWATSSGIQLECHRSGYAKIKSSNSRKRELKKLGSVKIDAHCPARIRAKFCKDGTVQVHCVLTHAGHDLNVRRMPLSKQIRERLATALSMKIPISDILSGFENKPKDGQPTRDDFITRKDLHNIIRDFRLSKEGIFSRKSVGSSPKREKELKKEIKKEDPEPRTDPEPRELDTRTYFAEYVSSNNPTSDQTFIILEGDQIQIEEQQDDVFTPEFGEIVFHSDQVIDEEPPAPNPFYAEVKEELLALVDRVEQMTPEQIEACYTTILSLKDNLSNMEAPS